MTASALPTDGLIVVAKRDCPTCTLIEPVYRQLADSGIPVSIYSQDDPGFPANVPAVADDRSLEASFHLDIEIVPTVIRMRDGTEAGRSIGWHRGEWEALTGVPGLGEDLPDQQPGCGSLSVEPGMRETLLARFGGVLKARQIEVSPLEDPMEVAYERGWSDGLPVTPPTDERVIRMLSGTNRDPQEIVGLIPPNLAECTVEKVAINAVMAGCKPEYMPVVLGVVEAALLPNFAMHGLLCTLYFSGPVVIVNGPITRRIGMNCGLNALGQGNRANATIGRALQLIIRNVGGGVPGGIDRSALGNPGKYTFCFAEDESDEEWEPLSVSRGIAPGKSAVTLFHGDGVTAFVDHRSRTPEDLVKSMATSLVAVGHVKLAQYSNAILVLTPEHYRVFREAGWDRRSITDALHEATTRSGGDLILGAQGLQEGIDPKYADQMVPKFWRDHGLLIVRAGGEAGMFSGIIGGWSAGRFHDDVQPVTKEIIE
jgi:hypothetical protein